MLIKILQLEDFWKVSTVKMIKIPLIDTLNVRKYMTLLLTLPLMSDKCIIMICYNFKILDKKVFMKYINFMI